MTMLGIWQVKMSTVTLKHWFVFIAAALIFCAGASAFAESLCVDLTESNRLTDGKEFAAVTLSYIYNGDKRG